MSTHHKLPDPLSFSLKPTPAFPALFRAAITQPAIDNHAHPLLKAEFKDTDRFPFEGLVSEADGEALSDAKETLAGMRAVKELRVLYGINSMEAGAEKEITWDDLKRCRREMGYDELCGLCFGRSGIEMVFVDDGLGGEKERAMVEGYEWMDRWVTKGKGGSKRIVRVEVIAEELLRDVLGRQNLDGWDAFRAFENAFLAALNEAAQDENVVGFKSVVCYRTGMNVAVDRSDEGILDALQQIGLTVRDKQKVRLAHKPLNDFVVNTTLDVSATCSKPVQFHTGLGDNDITLTLSSPAHLQPIIKAHPEAKIVLLHSSYPYTREAGYLTAVYRNVYLDFGEVFPFVSADGQKSILRQVLELCPTNKMMWSSDGHWWPESYYLGIMQARTALYEVLAEQVKQGVLTENEGMRIIELSLYCNAKTLYKV